MADILVDGEVFLYGTVGEGLWGDGFTARDVVMALAEVGRGNDVVVRLNSGGGFASEGAAIYNALANHRGHKTVYVDGIAASAASLIAMAGDQINMRKGSVMMIHDPSGFTMGSAADHAKSIESLNALADSFAEIYAERTGKSVDDARADMREEVWLTPQQAIERGYATAAIEAEAAPPTMFAYHLYEHAPQPVMAVANTSKPPKSQKAQPVTVETLPGGAIEKWQAWKPAAAPTAAQPRQKEPPMPNEPAVENTAIPQEKKHDDTVSASAVSAHVDAAVAAYSLRTEAILDCEEAKDRETLARHLAFKTTLSADDAKAALAAAPKAQPAQVNAFDRVMAAAGNPQVGPDSGNGHDLDEVAQMANQAIALYRGANKGSA